MNRHTLTLRTMVLLALGGRPAVADDSCSIRAMNITPASTGT